MTDNRSSLIRGAVVGGLVALGLLVLWVVITGLLGLRSAQQVQAQTQTLTDQLAQGDSVAAASTLAELQGSSSALDSTLNSPPWSQMASLPVVGPSVRVFADIAEGTAAVSATTRGQEELITSTIAKLKRQGLSGVGSLTALQPFTQQAAQAIAGPSQRVAAVSADEIFAPLREFTQTRQEQFLGVAQGLRAAEGATVALPALLGADGPRTWLVTVQNDAEARGTGGLLSAYSIVEVRNGILLPRSADTTNALFNQPAIPVAGIPKDTQELWGADQLGRWWGFNLDRHFPFAGLLMGRGSPVQVDDVITIDARVVAGLMTVTGPVTAAGVTVTADEAAEFFTATIYERFPNADRKDAATIALINQMLRQLATADLNPVALWDALASSASQGRLLTYSTDARVQEALEKMPTAGVVPTDPGPWASAAFNDFAGNKISAYVQVQADYRSAAFCPTPGAESTVAVSVTNNAPEGLPDYVDVRTDRPGAPKGTGSTNMGVAVYAPVGSVLRGFSVDGVDVAVAGGTDRDHPVWQTALELERGQTVQVEARFEEPRVARQPITFSAQPMVQDMVTSTGEAGC